MAQRVGILNGSNLMQDKDVGTLIDALTNSTGFIVGSGLAVTTNSVAPGKALIECTRTSTTPNETVWVVFENTSAVTISTAGTSKVWIAIDQTRINDGTLNTDPTGAGIGVITVGANYPASNYIPLAVITAGVIADARPSTTLSGHVVNGILKHTMGTPIASATTTDLSTVVGNRVHVTGTTPITGFGTLQAGTEMCVIFDGALTLTHNGTSLIIPGGANITTAAGDIAYLISEGSGNWRVSGYQKANGQAISATTDINGTTEALVPIIANDYLIEYNAALGANRKIKIKNIFGVFGDGSDGNVTITTSVSLTRDMYYNNLTVNSPGILDPNGYKIFVMGTLSGTGIIRRNGNTGGDGSAAGAGSPAGGTAGSALNQGTLNAEVAGVAGGIGGTVGSKPGANGLQGIIVNPAYSATSGGTGGAGLARENAGGTGGTAGTGTQGTNYNKIFDFSTILGYLCNPASAITTSLFGTQYKTGASGGSGGGASYWTAGSQNGASGGGSGSNGGMIWISASIINFAGGTMESKGGNGGNGGSGAGGGASGGSGGIIYLISRTFTSIGTQTVTGGTAGTGNVAGSSGSAGATIQITV